jgi:hypothetical protein
MPIVLSRDLERSTGTPLSAGHSDGLLRRLPNNHFLFPSSGFISASLAGVTGSLRACIKAGCCALAPANSCGVSLRLVGAYNGRPPAVPPAILASPLLQNLSEDGMHCGDRLRVIAKVESSLLQHSHDLSDLHSCIRDNAQQLTTSFRQAMERIKGGHCTFRVLVYLRRNSVKRHGEGAGINPFAVLQQFIKRGHGGLERKLFILQLTRHQTENG